MTARRGRAKKRYLTALAAGCLALGLAMLGAAAAKAITADQLEEHVPWVLKPSYFLPPEPDESLLVLVGLHLHQITSIALRDQEFTALVTMTLQWNDPRMRFDMKAMGTNRLNFQEESARTVLNNIWSPAVMIYNATSEASTPNSLLSVYADGLVRLSTQMTVTGSHFGAMRAFPFDNQTLSIIVTTFGRSSDAVRLEALDFTSSEDVSRVVPPEFTFKGSGHRVEVIHSTGEGSPRGLVFDIELSRDGRYYVWRHMLPLILLVFISATTFWMTGTTLHDRLKVISISMLAIVTFMLYLSRELPHVNYLTALGVFYAWIWSVPIIAVVVSLFVTYYQDSQQAERALAWDRGARRIIPYAFLSLIVVVAAYVFAFR